VRPDPSFPIDLADLAYGEHLIVWAFRAFAKGRDCPIVRREFDHGCGARAGEAFGAMRVFVQQWATRGRPIVPAPPGGLTLTRDERALLNLFAAAQTGDGAGFAAHFRALTGSASNPIVERAVTLVAEAMARRGHRLGAFEDVAPWDLGEGASRLIA
jgi:hypothetical protein